MSYIENVMLVSAIVEMLFAIPAGLILKRLGLSPWWALVCFVPVVALFGVWILAFIGWPARDDRAPQSS